MLGLKLNHVSKRGPRRLHTPLSDHTISYSWYNHVQGLAQKYYFSMHGDLNRLLFFCRWHFLMKILASYWVSIILLHTRITMIHLESTVGFNDLCNIFIFISTDCKPNLLIVAQWCHMASWNFVSLAQVMACRLMAPSHYQNMCWLLIIGVLHHSPEVNNIGNAHQSNHCNTFENHTF